MVFSVIVVVIVVLAVAVLVGVVVAVVWACEKPRPAPYPDSLKPVSSRSGLGIGLRTLGSTAKAQETHRQNPSSQNPVPVQGIARAS